MKKVLHLGSAAILAFLFLAVGSRNAAAQVPTKTITIYNDSKKDTIYPVLAGFVGDVDLWLQAQFKVSPGNSGTQTFCNNSPTLFTPCPSGGGSSGKPPILFRAYINEKKGIAPGESVTITVPFYTQLKSTDSGTLGKYSAQYIDWWNAGRIFFYDGKTAETAAYNYNVDQNGKIIPPTTVNPVSGAVKPACATGNIFKCEPVEIVSYIGVYPTGSVPFQLAEYTFAAAEGPPPGGLLSAGSDFSIDLKKTNFNISAVDGIYLPVAMEAILENDPVAADSEYLGTDERVQEFRQQLENFIQNGPEPSGVQWPYYYPSYFSSAAPTTPHNQPQDGDSPYPLPSIPSANVVLAESYKIPAPAPPVISSNTSDDEGKSPMLGSTAQGMVNLWNKCTEVTSSSVDDSVTCQKIREVYDFFSLDYNNTCKFTGSPSTPIMLREVYGWAQFANCPLPLVRTPGYDTAIVDYCGLQYNYLTNVKPDDTFNPYTRLVHKTLKSNAYAFSIDDKAAFKSVPSTNLGTSPGLILTIGGSEGLIDKKQVELPNAENYETYCH